MNKLLISVMLLVGLSGCSDYSGDVKKLLTNQEKVMLETYYVEYEGAGYNDTLRSIKIVRASRPYHNLEVPFCDVLPTLLSEDNPSRHSYKTRMSIVSSWELINRITLEESCMGTVPTIKQTLPQVIPKTIIVPDTPKVVDKILPAPLPLEMYEKLETLVVNGKCKSADNKLLSIMSERALLLTDYAFIENIIIGCTAFKLRTKLEMGL